VDESPQLTEGDIHHHLRVRMEMRGLSLGDLNLTLANGWPASDAVPGTEGRTWVLEFEATWEGRFYREKRSRYTSSEPRQASYH
jgi:hypothetical protein